MKGNITIILVIIILIGSIISLIGCGSESSEVKATETLLVTVQRGDLTVDITAAGNLALSRTEDLAFEMAGTVEEVLVNEGDSVTEEQELVKLDTSEWDDQLKTLEKALVTAQRALTTAERLIGDKELAVRQAELDLQTAEYDLGQIDKVEEAQDAVDEAEYDLKIAKSMLLMAEGSEVDSVIELIDNCEAILDKAQNDLQDILSGSSVSVSTDVAIAVAKCQLAVEQEQRDIEAAQIALENAWIDKGDAEQDVEDAQNDLNEAKGKSPIITAPFDGFITKVNVEGGDEIMTGTVAVQLADPEKFEADILVGEMDILQVKVGGEAWVQVDAMSGLTLPAEVTHISPTATIQSGVVNYEVKVEVQSLEAAMQERQEAMQDISSGELPEQLKRAIEEGRITQEQADEKMKQMQSGERQSQAQMPTMIPRSFQLREGLTVTVTIVMEQRSDVLLVPNSAVTYQGGAAYVQVSENGVIEERAITTGISNWQYTEVTEGLSEGEEIIVSSRTATTVPTTQQGQGGTFIPGMGRVR